jgi:hypothetical protein
MDYATKLLAVGAILLAERAGQGHHDGAETKKRGSNQNFEDFSCRS